MDLSDSLYRAQISALDRIIIHRLLITVHLSLVNTHFPCGEVFVRCKQKTSQNSEIAKTVFGKGAAERFIHFILRAARMYACPTGV